MHRPTWLKALLASLGVTATWGVTAGADGAYDQVELWGLLGVVVTALSVYYGRNGESTDPTTSTPEV